MKAQKRKKKTEIEEVTTEDPGGHAGVCVCVCVCVCIHVKESKYSCTICAPLTEPQTKVRRKGKSFYLKPANGCKGVCTCTISVSLCIVQITHLV